MTQPKTARPDLKIEITIGEEKRTVKYTYGFTAALLGFGLLAFGQPCIRYYPWLDIITLRPLFGGSLLGFIEDAVPDLLAALRVTMRTAPGAVPPQA